MNTTHTVTLGVLGMDLLVTFRYYPAEKAQHYGPAPYPGAPEDVEILSAVYADVDLVPHLSATAIDAIEEAAMEYMQECGNE